MTTQVRPIPTPTPPAVVPDSPTPGVKLYKCCNSSRACTSGYLLLTESFVPELKTLFFSIRGNTFLDKAKPLTEAEIRPYVLCWFHSNGHRVQGKRVPLSHTLELMARWNAVNDAQVWQRRKRVLDREAYLRSVCGPHPVTVAPPAAGWKPPEGKKFGEMKVAEKRTPKEKKGGGQTDKGKGQQKGKQGR